MFVSLLSSIYEIPLQHRIIDHG
uniref:Putative vacuolar protein sorting-associated protein 13A isoform X7 n=1 Tax=Rhizophora mucronata TaxID=61149 RepID=A0A2P2MK26_RHIMU